MRDPRKECECNDRLLKSGEGGDMTEFKGNDWVKAVGSGLRL